MFNLKKLTLSFSLLTAACSMVVAAPVTHTSIESSQGSLEQVAWQLSPLTGVSVISGDAAYNIGAAVSTRALERVPLYVEPSLVVGIRSMAQFHTDLGARYDIAVPDTNVLPFVRFAVGPTFQTSGSAIVFNMFAGGGINIPMQDWSLRADIGMLQVDGHAGFQFLAGVNL